MNLRFSIHILTRLIFCVKDTYGEISFLLALLINSNIYESSSCQNKRNIIKKSFSILEISTNKCFDEANTYEFVFMSSWPFLERQIMINQINNQLKGETKLNFRKSTFKE
ncbi:hypothetical protein BpHYR1_008553 [Brachionus plicatilis]|uniref:Uncharacterized protein n=1 Tax=Brachionus plicatilis TaxID=10195 RepID=A0A3M7PDF7_BRAPC|nr:hypothetical protein BpHYR1_008553 [Brachionus plicatilis]